MAWVAPRTWTAGEVVTASMMNQDVRDNMNYVLSGRGVAQVKVLSASNYTITSSTFVYVDTTNLALTLSINSGRIMGWWTFSELFDNTAHNGKAWVGTDRDAGAAMHGDATYGTKLLLTNHSDDITLPFYFSGLSAASHTLKLMARTDGSAGASITIYKATDTPVYGMAFEI